MMQQMQELMEKLYINADNERYKSCPLMLQLSKGKLFFSPKTEHCYSERQCTFIDEQFDRHG